MNANILTKLRETLILKKGFFKQQKNLFLLIILLVLIPFVGLVMANEAKAEEFEPLANIQRIAEEFAITQLDTTGLSNITAAATKMDSRLRLVKCESPIKAFSSGSRGNVGRSTVGVRCSGSKPWSLYVPVTINAMADVVSTLRPLVRGELLQSSDLQMTRKPVKQLPANYLRSIAELSGMEASRPIQSGKILTLNMVKATPLIQKGQEVIISATSGSIEVRMNGIALRNGASGELIPIRNINSGRTIEGQILNANTVTVKL